MDNHKNIFGKHLTEEILKEAQGITDKEYIISLITNETTMFMIKEYVRIGHTRFPGFLIDKLVVERKQHMEAQGEF